MERHRSNSRILGTCILLGSRLSKPPESALTFQLVDDGPAFLIDVKLITSLDASALVGSEGRSAVVENLSNETFRPPGEE